MPRRYARAFQCGAVSIKGDVYCSVTLGSGEDVPGIGALEEAAGGTTHIAESANQTTAEALGTLCNRIYGSGNTTPDLSSLLAADAAASASEAASAVDCDNLADNQAETSLNQLEPA